MKKKLFFWGNIAVFTLCVALVIAASFYALSVRQLNVVYTPADSKESTADITNPFCGFYKINGYVLAEDKTARDADIWCQRSCKDTTYPLMLLEINLRNYADQDLSANALSQLNRIFKICEKKKKQIILRFLYDWDGKAKKTEPSDFYRIKNHIQQVSATVNAHADCIYILQGLFIGNNGEMNNTNYGDIDQMRQLAETLAKNISLCVPRLSSAAFSTAVHQWQARATRGALLPDWDFSMTVCSALSMISVHMMIHH